jgi:hypothetical protein
VGGFYSIFSLEWIVVFTVQGKTPALKERHRSEDGRWKYFVENDGLMLAKLHQEIHDRRQSPTPQRLPWRDGFNLWAENFNKNHDEWGWAVPRKKDENRH